MTIIPNNLGFAPDSMVYLEVSESILHGNGFSNDSGKIVDHYPPLFSMGIAVISYLTGIAPQNAGIVFQPFLLGLFVFIFYKVLEKMGADEDTAILSTLLLAVSQTVTNYLFFLSEGMFLVVLLTVAFFLISWYRNYKQMSLVKAGIFSGLLFLTRYAAVGFIGGFLLFVIMTSGKNARIKNILLFMVALTLVVLPWLIYVGFAADSSGGREAGVYIISLSKLLEALKTFGYWFLGSIPAIICTGVLLIIYLFQLTRHYDDIKGTTKKFLSKYQNIILFPFIVSSAYFLFLIVSISFYDPWTPLDNRILLPVFPFVLMLIAILMHELKLQEYKWLYISSFVLLFTSFSSSVFPVYARHFKEGSGYTREKWRDSEILNYLSQRSSSKRIYTNGIEITRLNANKKTELLPFKSDEEAWEELIAEVRKGEAEILFLNEVDWRGYLISGKQILEEFEHSRIKEYSDGFIVTSAE